MHKSYWQQLGQYNDFPQIWDHFIMKSSYNRKILILLGTCYTISFTDFLCTTSWHAGCIAMIMCFLVLKFQKYAWWSVLCSCAWVYVGSCQECRGPVVWVLGPWRNDPLKSTEIVSEGSSRMQDASSCWQLLWDVRPVSTDALSRVRGCVCPPAFLAREMALI